MTFSDYLIDSVLVLLVFRQLREIRFDTRAVVLPLAIIGWVIHSYLHDVPTGASDLTLLALATVVGIVFGTVSATTTRMRSDGAGHALVRAGLVAAGVWVLSMGFRFAFAIWATHGGGPDLAQFTLRHGLDLSVWTPTLVLMAAGEVVSRTGILWVRSRRLQHAAPAPQRELVAS